MVESASSWEVRRASARCGRSSRFTYVEHKVKILGIVVVYEFVDDIRDKLAWNAKSLSL